MTDLKIRIPLRQHVRLHAAKYVTGKPISEMIAEAIEQYLPARLEQEP